MTDYIVEEEQQLSPVVVASSAVLVAAFVLGFLYQLALFVL
ncbi:hypothetical protein [Natronomonas sp. CBA1123]|jgi:hypothetical protein|nr:hypothetical protein [Natronomonas sp. CBA1123]